MDGTKVQSSATITKSPLFIHDAFIDGQWTRSERTFPVYDPSTESELGQVVSCTREHFVAAIESAARAQADFFSTSTSHERGQMLRRWADLILQNKQEIATILSLENGKTIAEAVGEVVYATSFVSWFAEEATRTYGTTIPSSTPNTTVMTIRAPIGVCGIITPWNFPAAMITRKIAPALAAGCSVVIKPPSETPFTCLALTKLAIDAGLPPKVIQVCPTKDREASLELATNPLVRKISFTGSTNVGKMLAKLAAGTLKRLSLELGGNAPFIVFDDADVELAVAGAIICKFRCTGQTCVCANRIFVQRGIAERFIKRLVEKVSELKMGHSLESSTTQGPLVNKAAVDKVAQHVQDALSKGGKLEIGGKPDSARGGFFFQPTVVSGATPDMLVAREETFGPLAPVFLFDTEAEVIKMSNDTEFGLAGYFFSKDIGRVLRVAKQMQVGMVGVNTGKISAAETPFGGVKESGYGREGSSLGMDEYTVVKSITIGNTDV
ncbi:Glutarate-semialdehyde dehydrogenase DavD [Elsinoe australis]|uniref:Succinate-semialdehyde dehydrogenase, mitochondrial n=1 Tax=Elsinoe australis TaxID=40998 RepID=A0A2P7Z0Q2_9PEZI|nr:Glutarate-semialdehyde dehydrogenase DavD [Elsinoe australis]